MVLVSDGVHDNLDPESLGLEASECGLESWVAEPQVITHLFFYLYIYK